MREVYALRHLSINTETTYTHWLGRYGSFHKDPKLKTLTSERKIEAFLTRLALTRVSASTQNQAFNAVMFFYRAIFLGNNRRHLRAGQARAALATLPLRFAPAPAPRPASAHLPALPGHRGALHRTRRTLRQSQPLCPPLALRAGSRLHRYLMTPRPRHRRQCPPATAVLLESRNGHAQALPSGAPARSRRLQGGHVRPPTARESRSDPPTTPYAERCHLGKLNLLRLLPL